MLIASRNALAGLGMLFSGIFDPKIDKNRRFWGMFFTPRAAFYAPAGALERRPFASPLQISAA